MKRYLDQQIANDLDKKLVILTGPRQVGKTTLSRQLLTEKDSFQYLNWDISSDRRILQDGSWSQQVPLLIFDEIHKMHQWSLHENHHVRRLASEGSRPRLPWAMALPELKKNPAAILPILDHLKNDSSEYVRRSVANSLNDIAKDHPDVVLEIAKQWKGHSKETDAIIKHGSRTLLKQGNADILLHFNLHHLSEIEARNFNIKTQKISIGEYLEFSFTIQNKDHQAHYIRLEYGIHYLRQNGQYNKKVFKIAERIFQPQESLEYHRKQSFKIITTRKFYTGIQYISLIINGKERDILSFQLED